MLFDSARLSHTLPEATLDPTDDAGASATGAGAAGALYAGVPEEAWNPGPLLPGKGFMLFDSARLAQTLPEATLDPTDDAGAAATGAGALYAGVLEEAWNPGPLLPGKGFIL